MKQVLLPAMAYHRDLTTLAGRVRYMRAQRNLSQQQLGERAGLVQSEISKIERGRIRKTGAMLALARALCCETNWLATGRGSPAGDASQQPSELDEALERLGDALTTLDSVGRKHAGFLLETMALDPQGPWREWLLQLMLGIPRR